MYQQDFDAVKSRLRGLWSQPTNDSPRSANTPNSTETEGVEELLLFPTFAFRDERLKAWRVQVRGWAFCRQPNTRRVRWAATLMRRFIRIPAGGAEDGLLVDRVSHLFAGPPASTEIARVAMAGIAEPAAFELRAHHVPPQAPRRRSDPPQAVNLLDAPLELTSRPDPSPHSSKGSHRGHHHDRLVRQDSRVAPTIMQKTLQIDAFAWQSLVLDEGQFSGEILVGFNELEWLLQSFGGRGARRLIELQGELPGAQGVRAVGVAHLVEPRGVSVVSDIDDTIKASNITAEKRILLETVFARPLQAVPGMSALYSDWYSLGAEFHYVSNSPWQLYPSLDSFFHANRFPPGSAHLRSFDPGDLLSIKNYTGTPQMKRDTIEHLFKTFPERKFVLVGDCGEHDLETYADLARRYPARVVRIYIRDLFAPLRVEAVTTHTDVADRVARGVAYGVVGAQGNAGKRSSSSGSDSGAEEKRVPPVLPPKPERLRGRPINTNNTGPPPKPPRSAPVSIRKVSGTSNESRSYPKASDIQRPDAVHTHSSNPTNIQRTQSGGANTNIQRPGTAHTHDWSQPAHMQRTPTLQQQLPGSWTQTEAQNVPQEPMTPTELLQARVRQLRQEAQQWLAFYAQQFYVAPTRSYLRHMHMFMPTVERDMRIIDYDAIAVPNPDAPPILADIPEPPPPEAQLARSERRLLLWKRYLACTRALPPRMCRLFVDASDIRQDTELTSVIFPQHNTQL
ncbi:hypothetical protein IWW56_003564 [Coemansia sp. RSA 2131]|nr:hypothetical protein IWW56_003564 [Coemansia sp. RSA 2131]